MYDCLDYNLVKRPALTTTMNQTRFHLHLQWRDHPRLQLKLAPQTAPHRLNLAYAAALSMSFPTHSLPDGSLLILGLNLNEALLFQRRFSDLLANYEPARHSAPR